MSATDTRKHELAEWCFLLIMLLMLIGVVDVGVGIIARHKCSQALERVGTVSDSVRVLATKRVCRP